MKNAFFISLIFFFKIAFALGDIPTVFVELLKTDSLVTIQSHYLFNIDKNKNVPKSFISGNDTLIVESFTFGQNRLEVQMLFPLKQNGRRLNPTTTVHLSIFMNGKKIVYTEHFGQNSQTFVVHPDSILCRPDVITFYRNDKEDIRLTVQGLYTPKKEHPDAVIPPSDERFKFDYRLPSSTVNDEKLIQDVKKHGPSPMPLNHIEELLTINAIGLTATYSFISNTNNLSNQDPYDWGVNSFLYSTIIASESELIKLFNPHMYEYAHFSEKSTIRIFDPKITYSSSYIRFHPDNLVYKGKNTYELSNLTDNYVLLKGLQVLNPINQKSLKINFPIYWTIESVRVEKNTRYEVDNNSVYLYGDGLSRLNYTINVREKE